ncbi:hypothetical protein [Tropicibacter sp. S64]|uniref:hypothetical protein n=1 Tax=Tropicibacter sp. S64 TaxID=3415122 RepID=UPI003C7C5B0B
MIRYLAFALALGLAAPAVLAASLDGQETYDLLFRQGTLDGIDRDKALIYDRTVVNGLLPAAATRDSGEIALSFGDEDSKLAQLEFRQDGKHRGLGQFPASVGNPMIMYFYETVIRDMAETAGGSPFYIRNRVKEALVQPSEVVEGEADVGGQVVPTRTIVMRPFEGDPNVHKMQGFGALEMTVVMSEAVPGWYVSLSAEAGDVYSSRMLFEAVE